MKLNNNHRDKNLMRYVQIITDHVHIAFQSFYNIASRLCCCKTIRHIIEFN